MWMEEQRRIYRREGDGYPSDLRDVEWARLAPLIPPALPGGRPRTDMRAAMTPFCFAADRLPLALSAARQLSAALDRLQYLSQVPALWRLGGDLGRAAYGIARANGSGSQPLGGGSRQPVDQIGRKMGGNDNEVGYDSG
jgi:hypothetical protein